MRRQLSRKSTWLLGIMSSIMVRGKVWQEILLFRSSQWVGHLGMMLHALKWGNWVIQVREVGPMCYDLGNEVIRKIIAVICKGGTHREVGGASTSGLHIK